MADISETAGAELVRVTDGTSVLFGTTAGTVSISNTSSTIQSLYAGVGYTPVRKNVQYTSAQTNTTIWQPASGKKWYMTDLIISTSTESRVTLIDTTATLITFHFGASGGAVSNFKTPLVAAATNGTLKLVTTASTCSVLMSGYEV